MGVGLKEVLVIILIAIVLFGATRIPKALGGLGKGIHAFKKGLKGEDIDDDDPGKPAA
jgi:sec-independent protein translocase protein TatA